MQSIIIIIVIIQATTAIVEKTVRAFYSTIAVEERSILIKRLKLCHMEQKFIVPVT